MNYSKIIDERRKTLQQQIEKSNKDLQALSDEAVTQKFQEREELLNRVKAIEGELVVLLGESHEALFGAAQKRGPKASSSSSVSGSEAQSRKRRKSLREEEKLEKIQELLKVHSKGLSAKEITERIGDTYNTVSEHLARHSGLYLRSGSKKSTVYRLH